MAIIIMQMDSDPIRILKDPQGRHSFHSVGKWALMEDQRWTAQIS